MCRSAYESPKTFCEEFTDESDRRRIRSGMRGTACSEIFINPAKGMKKFYRRFPGGVEIELEQRGDSIFFNFSQNQALDQPGPSGVENGPFPRPGGPFLTKIGLRRVVNGSKRPFGGSWEPIFRSRPLFSWFQGLVWPQIAVFSKNRGSRNPRIF